MMETPFTKEFLVNQRFYGAILPALVKLTHTVNADPMFGHPEKSLIFLGFTWQDDLVRCKFGEPRRIFCVDTGEPSEIPVYVARSWALFSCLTPSRRDRQQEIRRLTQKAIAEFVEQNSGIVGEKLVGSAVASLRESLGAPTHALELVPGPPCQPCPDCKGTGRYVGLLQEEDCRACQGKGSL